MRKNKDRGDSCYGNQPDDAYNISDMFPVVSLPDIVSGFTIEWYLLKARIAHFTVNFSHLHYNVIQRGCEAISG